MEANHRGGRMEKNSICQITSIRHFYADGDYVDIFSGL